MKRVRWSEQASIEFEGIIQYIADDNPFAATRVAERIQSAISKLRRFNTGRIGRVRGTFEKVVAKTPYIVAYSLERAASDETELVVLHIIHGARGWPGRPLATRLRGDGMENVEALYREAAEDPAREEEAALWDSLPADEELPADEWSDLRVGE